MGKLSPIVFVLLGAALLLAGCNGAATPIGPTATASPVPVAARTMTPRPTLPAPTLAPTWAPTATAAPSATLPSAITLSGAKVISVSYLPKYRCLITLQTDHELAGKFYARVDTYKEYACQILPQHPNRLYCHGPLGGYEDDVFLQVYAEGIKTPVFEKEVYIPGF